MEFLIPRYFNSTSCNESRFSLTPTGSSLHELNLRTDSIGLALQGSWATWLLLQTVPHQVLLATVKLVLKNGGLW